MASRPKIAAYKVLESRNATGLEQLVMQALQAGWELQGGASFGAGSFFQAVIKVAEDKPDSQSI